MRELIAVVQGDAASGDALDQLAAAAKVVAELEAVGDAALTHFVEECRRNGRSWSEISKALGVTKQAAHKRFSLASPMLGRFTTRAAAVLPRAAAEAGQLGHNYVGTEHILLAFFADLESLASKVLTETGITHAEVEDQILGITPRGSAASGAPPLTPRALDCVERAVGEAVALGHNYVGTEHILLALFGNPESLSARILAELGATYDEARAAIIEKLSGFTTNAPPA